MGCDYIRIQKSPRHSYRRAGRRANRLDFLEELSCLRIAKYLQSRYEIIAIGKTACKFHDVIGGIAFTVNFFLCRFVLARGFEQSLHCRLTVIDKDDGNGRPAPPREQKAPHRMNPTRSRSRHRNGVNASYEKRPPNQKPPRPHERHRNQDHQPSPHAYRGSTPEALHKTQPDRTRNDDTNPNRDHDEQPSKPQPDEHPKKYQYKNQNNPLMKPTNPARTPSHTDLYKQPRRTQHGRNRP